LGTQNSHIQSDTQNYTQTIRNKHTYTSTELKTQLDRKS